VQTVAASSFLALRGIAKEVFSSLGGGETFIRAERGQFDPPPADLAHSDRD
jgi:hypothetical protein